MPVRKNGYYADPALGTAFDNLAQAFATPSGADVAGYARGSAEREKAARLSDFYRLSQDPNVDRAALDRAGIGVQAFTPTQSYYAQDQNNSTTRRGQDVAAGSAANVAGINNAGELARLVAGGVTLKDGETKYLGPDAAKTMQLPEMFRGNITAAPGATVTLPDNSVIAGAPIPKTKAQAEGDIIAALEPPERRAVGLQGVGVSQIVDAITGKPKNVLTPDAAGQTPYNVDNRQTQVASYKTADGKTGPGRLDPDTKKWVNTQTGVELPPDIQTYGATLTGDKDATGLGAPTNNKIDEQLLNLAMVEGTSKSLRALINANPGSQGIVGAIRGTVQDALAAGGEVAQLLNVNTKRFEADIASGRVDPEIVQKFANFDPSIPAVNMLETLLTAQMAKMYDPGGRVSNASWAIAKESIGAGGMMGNVKRMLGALDTLDNDIVNKRAMLTPVRPAAAAIRPVTPAGPPAPPISGPSAPAPTITQNGFTYNLQPDGSYK